MFSSIAIEDIVKEYDATLDELDFKNHDGFVFKVDWRYHIVVDQKLDSCKKRFAIAHEMGHIMDSTVDNSYCQISERRANNIAESLLVPEEKLREAREWFGDDFDWYAQLFGVSDDVMRRRCSII